MKFFFGQASIMHPSLQRPHKTFSLEFKSVSLALCKLCAQFIILNYIYSKDLPRFDFNSHSLLIFSPHFASLAYFYDSTLYINWAWQHFRLFHIIVSHHYLCNKQVLYQFIIPVKVILHFLLLPDYDITKQRQRSETTQLDESLSNYLISELQFP